MGAVLGEQFPPRVAAPLIDRPVAVCLPLLEEAASAGLVELASVAGDWRFSHALVRDALEARIPLADRVDSEAASAFAAAPVMFAAADREEGLTVLASARKGHELGRRRMHIDGRG